MTNFKTETRFRHEALRYIRDELARYPERSIGLRARLRDLRLESGSVFAFLPFAPPEALISEYGSDVFRHSLFHYRGGVDNIDHAYRRDEFQFIATWLRGATRSVALFQTDYSRFHTETGPFKLAPGERLLLCNSRPEAEGSMSLEGWVFVDANQSSPAEIELARARGFSPYPPTVALLTSLSTNLDWKGDAHLLTQNEVDELLSNASYLMVGAFDGEALLFWKGTDG